MNYVKSLKMLGVEARQLPCVSGNGSPTTKTVGEIGEFYMDTKTHNIYKCVAKNDGAYIWSEIEQDKVYIQKENLMPELEEGNYDYKYGTSKGTVSYVRTMTDNGQIAIESDKVYNIALNKLIAPVTYIFMYGEDGTYKGYKQIQRTQLPFPTYHIENGTAKGVRLYNSTTKVYDNDVTATDIKYVHISINMPYEEYQDYTSRNLDWGVMVWKSDTAEEYYAEWLNIGEKPSAYYTGNQVFSEKQLEEMHSVEAIKDRARFDSSFNYIAYSQVDESDGAINTAEHYEWAAKQGFTALKGDVRPTSDEELIMCHDAGFTIVGVSSQSTLPKLTVNSEGYITDGTNVYDGKTYSAYIGKYIGAWGGGTYNIVTYNEDDGTYTISYDDTIDETVITDADGGSAIVGAYTTDGQPVFCYTTGKYANKQPHYYAYANTFGIRKLNKDQCLSLQHSGTTNNICDFDTFIKICKKYGKIAFVTIRDEDIENIVVPKMFDTLDKYSMREQSIINSFTFDTLEKVRDADSRIMLSNVLGASKYLNANYITNAIKLKVCLINCADSAKITDVEGVDGFDIMGPAGNEVAETARGIELEKAQTTLETAQETSKEAADNALNVASSEGNADAITQATNIVNATQDVLDKQTALESAQETGTDAEIEEAQANLITAQKDAQTIAKKAVLAVASLENKDITDAINDAYDATKRVVKAQGTIDAISTLPDLVALAKANDIRLYEAQVTKSSDIDRLLEYGFAGAQMTDVPEMSFSLWEGGSY